MELRGGDRKYINDRKEREEKTERTEKMEKREKIKERQEREKREEREKGRKGRKETKEIKVRRKSMRWLLESDAKVDATVDMWTTAALSTPIPYPGRPGCGRATAFWGCFVRFQDICQYFRIF